MAKFLKILFSPGLACLLAVLVAGLLVLAIVNEPSVQPLRDQHWVNQKISAPLVDGVQFSQTLLIPPSLQGHEFLLGVLFGCSEGSCSGLVELTLKQGNHVQSRTASALSPRPTLRHRFSFTGFSEGQAVLDIKGKPEHGARAPGVLYTLEEQAYPLKGTGLPKNAYLSFDWFKVLAGEEKFWAAFPNGLVLVLWMIPLCRHHWSCLGSYAAWIAVAVSPA